MRGDRTAALVRACHRGIREFCLSAYALMPFLATLATFSRRKAPPELSLQYRFRFHFYSPGIERLVVAGFRRCSLLVSPRSPDVHFAPVASEIRHRRESAPRATCRHSRR